MMPTIFLQGAGAASLPTALTVEGFGLSICFQNKRDRILLSDRLFL